MCDIGERATMHNRKIIFKGLDDVGSKRLFEQRGHSALGLKVTRADWFAGE